ncbi:MAG TPA: tetratricopeptide repeat protein [Ktedonobacterales bacterium]
MSSASTLRPPTSPSTKPRRASVPATPKRPKRKPREQINPEDPRYPRRSVVRFLRGLLVIAWGGVLYYVVRAAVNIFQLVHAAVENPSQSIDQTQIAGALLVPAPFNSETTPLWIIAGFGIAFFLVVYATVWAARDAEYERKVLYTREIAEALSRNLPGTVRERLATAARNLTVADQPEVQGPPFDDVLLPLPEQFVGRDADLEWLMNRLRADEPGSVSAITGLDGVGKTSLVAAAVRALHAEDRFPDGIAVVLCSGLTDPLEVTRRVLARFDQHRRQPDVDDLAGLTEAARRAFAGKNALVVLDDVEPGLNIGAVVRVLRVAGAHTLLDAEYTLPRTVVPPDAARMLDLLSPDEAADVFAHAYGLASLTGLTVGERTAVYRIIAALGRHTLAVKLAGAYAADLRRDLVALARELENPARAFTLPQGETPRAVSLAFAHSVDALPPEARRLFTALAAFPTDEFSRNAVLALGPSAGVSEIEPGIYLLVTRALVGASTSGRMPEGSDRERLRLHPLLRAFAAGEFARWKPKEREAALRAVAAYYAGYVQHAPSSVFGPDEANIVGALEWAHEHNQQELVAALCAGMQDFWRDRWRTPASLRYLPWGMEAAQSLARKTRSRPDRLRAANLALAYAQTLRRLGKIEQAEQALQENLALRRSISDRVGEALVLAQLGYIALSRRELDDADELFSQALALFRETGNRQGEGETLGFLGQIAQYRGQIDAAEARFNEALHVLADKESQRSTGHVLTRLGKIAQARGDLDGAERYYEQALSAERATHNAQDEGITLMALGDVHAARGQMEAAEQRYHDGVALLHDIQDIYHYAAAALALGGFLIEHDGEQPARYDEGCDLVREAVKLYGEMGLRTAEEGARERAKELGCEL